MKKMWVRLAVAVTLLALCSVPAIDASPTGAHRPPAGPAFSAGLSTPPLLPPIVYMPMVTRDGAVPHVVQFDSGNLIVGEAEGTVNVAVTLSTQAEHAVTVQYTMQDGSAHAGEDYAAAQGTLTFAPGQTSATIPVTIEDDSFDEPDEWFSLALSAPTGALLGLQDTMTVTIDDNDGAPTMRLASDSYEVQEGAGTAALSITLNAASQQTVTVDYTTSNGTAEAGSDYGAISGTLSLAPGETSATVRVTIVDDAVDEPDKQFQLALSDPTHAVLGTPGQATVTVIDDDPPPTVQLSRDSPQTGESAGTAAISVTLSAASGQTTLVDYATSDGTAQAGKDYEAAANTLSFAPGQTSRTITISIIDDTFDEPDESFQLALSAPVNAVLGAPDTATITLLDDDDPPRVQLSDSQYEANEGAGTAIVEVRLSAAAEDVVTVDYGTQEGTAQAGSDYEPISGTLSLAPGETRASISIPIVDDTMDEVKETFQFVLDQPSNALLGARDRATVSIVDNDPRPTVQWEHSSYEAQEGAGTVTLGVILGAASQKTVAVEYATSNGTAQAGEDYEAAKGTLTIAPGETRATISVILHDDAVDEPEQRFYVALGDPNNAVLGTPDRATVTLVDDDLPPVVRFDRSSIHVQEDAGTANAVVRLDTASIQTVTVEYATSDGTAQAGKDYEGANGTLTFAPGQTSRTIAVPITDDTFDEPDESFELALSAPVNAALGTPDTMTLTIEDDDSPPTVQLGSRTYGVGEGAGTISLDVILSAAAEGPVTVEYATSDGTADAGVDYTTSSGTLTFAPGEVSRTIDVTIEDDILEEPDETFKLALSQPGNAVLGSRDVATVTIDDDDQPVFVQLESSSYTIDEDAGTVTIVATLSAEVDVTVTVDYATSDGTAQAGSDYSAKQGTLTFSTGSTRRSIAVSILDDTSDENDEWFSVQLDNPTHATLGAPDTATVTLNDDDEPPPPPPPSGPSSFGLQIAALHQFASTSSAQGNSLPEQEVDAAAYVRLTDALRASGAGWARVYVNWAEIQPSAPVPGQPPDYQWQWYDDRLGQVASTGVKLLVTVANAPSWAADRGCAPIYTHRLDEFAQFLTDLVHRYKAAPYRARHWELLNEPDFDGSNSGMVGKSCWGNDPDRYTEMLAVAYPAIKAADSQAKVIMGGLAYDAFTENGGPFVRYFPDGVMESGGARYMDALNIHYFQFYRAEWERWTPDDPPTCGIVDDGRGRAYDGFGIDAIAKVSHFRNRMSVCHGVNKPLWVTEMGLAGRPGNPGSLARQARYVIQGSVRALAAGAEHVTWFALTAPNDSGDHLDLLYEDWSPKPSFFAYQALTSELTGYGYVRTLNVSRGEGYLFENSESEERTVAWGSRTLVFSPASSLRVVDREGDASTVRDGGSGDEDGSQNRAIELQLSDNPVFVTIVE